MSTAKIPSKIPAKPGKDTVYIDVDDEITAIIDKVEAAKQKVVALVLPKRATVLQSVVNMRLLKRNAEKAAKNVVLITNEDVLLPLAGAVGLHVAKNLQTKPEIPEPPASTISKVVEDALPVADLDAAEEEPGTKLDYHRSIGELASTQEVEEQPIDLEDEDAPEEKSKGKEAKTKAPKDKKLSVPNFDRFRLLVLGGGGLFILLIVLIILAIFVLPKATITINTESIPVSANLNLTAADSVKTLDEANNAIPAILKTSQQTATQQVTATGQQNNGTKAKGTLSMSAGACSATVPSSVPAGTGVSTSGMTFITQETASFSPVISGGHCNFQSDSIDIVSQAAGAKYNVGSSNFTVSGYSNVTATGSASGGTDSIVTVVSQTDLDSAKGKLTSADTDKFGKDFQAQLTKQNFYLLASTFKLSDPAVTASPALGQPATTTTVTTQITYTILVVQKSDLTKAITDALNKKIDKTKQRLSDSDVLKGASVTVQTQNSATNVALSVDERSTAIPIIDQTVIKKQSTGQKSAAIKSAVESIPGVKSVQVDLSPFWVSKAPKVNKITVKLQPASSDKSSGG